MDARVFPITRWMVGSVAMLAVCTLLAGAVVTADDGILPSPPLLPAGTIQSPGDLSRASQLEAESDFAARAIYLINQERARHGLLPFHNNESLAASASSHSRDMALNDYVQHIGSDGSTVAARFVMFGYVDYTAGAENLAAGQSSPEEVVAAWLNSPLHAASLLSAQYMEAGIGHFFQPDDQPNVRLIDGAISGPFYDYWTLDLGTRSNVYPVVIELEAPTVVQRQVSLALHGQGRVQTVQIANDPTFAGASWRSYAPILTWELPPHPGQHTVYVRLRDVYGQESISTDTVTLAQPTDPPPTGQPPPSPAPILPAPAVSIESGRSGTASNQVTISITFPVQATQMEISQRADFTDATPQAAQSLTRWTLDSQRYGNQVVYVRYRVADGSLSHAGSDTILYDPLPPYGQIRLLSVKGSNAVVGLTAWDPLSPVTTVRLGVAADNLSSQPFAPSALVPLDGSANTPVVFAIFVDALGNASPLYRSDRWVELPGRIYLPAVLR